MGFFGLFGKKKSNISTSESRTLSEYCHPNLEYALNVFFEFADENKDKIVNILIHPSKRLENEVAFDLEFILDGQFDWYRTPNNTELFKLFKQCDNETFCKVIATVTTHEESKSYDYTAKKLISNINSYMDKYPERQFIIEPWGASKKIWDN